MSVSDDVATEMNETPLSEEELITLTKQYLANPSPDYWDDDDFVFRAPVIGPLAKKDIISTIESVSPEFAFEDLDTHAFGFTVGPLEHFVRPRGTFSKTYEHPVLGTIETDNS